MKNKLIIGVVILILGFSMAFFGYVRMQEYQTLAGQVARSTSDEARTHYLYSIGTTCFGGILLIIGIVVTALGIKQNESEPKTVDEKIKQIKEKKKRK